MKKVIQKLFMLCFLCVACSICIGDAAGAKKICVEFTGKMVVDQISTDLFPEGVDLSPTFKKGSKGVYTLTLYEDTIVRLKIKKPNKDYQVVTVRNDSWVTVDEAENNYLTISAWRDDWGEDPDVAKGTVEFQFEDDCAFDSKGNLNPNFGNTIGSKTKLKIVVKKCPKRLYEYAADEAMQEMNLQEEDSDLIKLKKIYDWVTTNIEYDYSEQYINMPDALLYHKSVCSGYAYLMEEFCNRVGIKTAYIGGISKGEQHAWNGVKIDGKWYLLDATWDAGYPTTYKWFLKSEKNFPNHECSYEDMKLAKNDYPLPDSFWEEYGRAILENKKKEYEAAKALTDSGFDAWLEDQILFENERDHTNIKIEELSQTELENYRVDFQNDTEKCNNGFLAWAGGYPSEEVYIECRAIEGKYYYDYDTQHEKLRAVYAKYNIQWN